MKPPACTATTPLVVLTKAILDWFRTTRHSRESHGFSSTAATAVKGFKVTHKMMREPKGSRDMIRCSSTPASHGVMAEEEEYNNCLVCSNVEIGFLKYSWG